MINYCKEQYFASLYERKLSRFQRIAAWIGEAFILFKVRETPPSPTTSANIQRLYAHREMQRKALRMEKIYDILTCALVLFMAGLFSYGLMWTISLLPYGDAGAFN